MFPTFYLLAAICTGANDCNYFEVDHWDNAPAGVAVVSCENLKRNYPGRSTGCYQLVSRNADGITVQELATGEVFDIKK